MTPKDKAVSLVDSYRNILMNEDTECGNEILCSVIAKKCALIAVELSLEYCNGKDINEEFDKVLFLVKVKNEIKKL
jgi:hypothetical protein